MPWARASALHRHLECAGASWLPRLDRGSWARGYLAGDQEALPSQPTTHDDGVMAQWGTNMHGAKARDPEAADPWLTWMDPHRERLWPDRLGHHEVCLSYDCRTGIVEVGPVNAPTKVGDAWKASRGPNCVTGTTDWWGMLPTGQPWVDDLKTGYPVPEVLSPQMLWYALCAAKVHGQMIITVSVTHWRRGWTEPERHWRKAGPAQLDAFEERLRDAWKKATGTSPAPVAGSHCRYCPSATVCPTVVGPEREESE